MIDFGLLGLLAFILLATVGVMLAIGLVIFWAMERAGYWVMFPMLFVFTLALLYIVVQLNGGWVR